MKNDLSWNKVNVVLYVVNIPNRYRITRIEIAVRAHLKTLLGFDNENNLVVSHFTIAIYCRTVIGTWKMFCDANAIVLSLFNVYSGKICRFFCSMPLKTFQISSTFECDCMCQHWDLLLTLCAKVLHEKYSRQMLWIHNSFEA